MTDEVTLHGGPCPCGCMMRRIADIEGRSDDLFVYPNGIVVHPMVFRSCLGQERSVVEYQVHQTKHGAVVSVRCNGPCDLDGLGRSLERALHSSGLLAPKVTVEIVVGFDRGDTGKLKRFFPMAIH